MKLQQQKRFLLQKLLRLVLVLVTGCVSLHVLMVAKAPAKVAKVVVKMVVKVDAQELVPRHVEVVVDKDVKVHVQNFVVQVV